MAKVATKKHSTFIDMTAMSDVTVLLLTFFMLTATFKPIEPVEVIAPSSVSERKVPDYDVMTILVDKTGHVFVSMDKPENRVAVLNKMAAFYNVSFTPEQKRVFSEQPSIGVPIKVMPAFLSLSQSEQNEEMKKLGVPTDSVNNQLANWVKFAVETNEDMKISIKADQDTPYPLVDKVMKTLVDIKQNRYSLITNLRGMPDTN